MNVNSILISNRKFYDRDLRSIWTFIEEINYVIDEQNVQSRNLLFLHKFSRFVFQ